MWNKIKNIFLYIVRTIFLLSLIIGYIFSMDFWAKEMNIDYGTSMSIGVIIACISLAQINKEQEEKKHNNEIEQKEMLNLVKLLYETDYSTFKNIASIVISNSWSKSIFLIMKNGFKINLNLSDISWIKNVEDIKKLDNFITTNPKKTEIEYALSIMSSKWDIH